MHIPREVTSDIDVIAEWYGSKELELKKRCREEIKTKLSQILTHPEMFQRLENDQRRAVLGSSFPYSVYYSLDLGNEKIEIQGVFISIKNL